MQLNTSARLTAVPVCPTCQAQLDSNARFCPKDGTTIRPDSVLVPVQAAGGASGEVAFKPTVPLQPQKRPRRNATATTDPSADPLIGRLLDGRYKVVARLGQGGVGAVYEAEHTQMKKVVAVKVLHPIYASTDEFRKRFEREARAASRLAHPSCVQVTDFGRVDKVEPHDSKLIGTPYLVMEFVRGTVLIDRLIDGPPIPPAEAVAITRDLLGALRHAHGMGIVHRDLKPANVMLLATAGDETNTRVKLLDFGLAKELLAEGDGKEQPLTMAGMVFGTPGYLSPEQASGRKVDARADLYSLGVLLFEMATNRRLFDRKDPLDAVRDHLHTPPPDPRSLNPAISPPLAKVILKALEKTPEKRWSSAEEFAKALTTVPEATGSTAEPIWQRALALRWLGRPAWQPAGAIAAVVTLILVLLVIARSGDGHVSGSAPIAAAPTVAEPAPARTSPKAQPRAQPTEAPRVAARTPTPRDGSARTRIADNYARKLWCSDAMSELEQALREQPDLRSSPDLSRPAIRCLTTRHYPRVSRFLAERVGADARGPLEAAAASDPNPEVRRNAQKLLERFPR
jgi:serine/threonine-protein kinase